MERLDKVISSQTNYSRKDVKDLVKKRNILVNGEVVLKSDIKVDSSIDKIVVLGEKLIFKKYVYLMLNKPKGYVSTAKDDRGRKTVLDLIPNNIRVYPVGRLDYNSEGLLLLTNDGELTNKLTHPKNSIGKTYTVKIEGTLLPETIKKIKDGIYLDGEKLRPCDIFEVKQEGKFTKLKMTIYQGKNRQIRRVFETFNHVVVLLKRTAIADLKLGSLDRGKVRTLTNKEVSYLKSL